MLSQSLRAPSTTQDTTAEVAGTDASTSGPAAGRSAAGARGNAFMQENLLADSAALREPSPGPTRGEEDWVTEILAQAPVPASGSGVWAPVMERVSQKVDAKEGQAAPAFELPPGTKILVDEQGRLRVWPGIRADSVTARLAAAGLTLEDLRPLAEPTTREPTTREPTTREPTSGPSPSPSSPGGVSAQGAADLNRLAGAASRPWYGSSKGKCYRAVAGYEPQSYMNRAGGRWKQLADRIPTDHAMWAVSFAHWLQETSHGRRAAAELGFTILESDGKTKLGDFLAARPELRGSIVVVPFGQEGTASQEWNAAAHYGSAKWGKGVGDISVVTKIGEKGATYVADGPVRHNNATMWWIVHPK
ncbi:MAG: hypothetical protein FJ090_06330 [Deltaproteobacteria bacterium]|nr:hypothetical protein [Deltaproteobacteria bacterium]